MRNLKVYFSVMHSDSFGLILDQVLSNILPNLAFILYMHCQFDLVATDQYSP